MNAYAAQDAQEDRRLEHTAWQDAVDTEVSELTTDAFNKLPQRLLDEVSEDLQEEIWKSLFDVIGNIRSSYAARYLR
ncbi:hypothetical protein JC794_08220 [Morganella morganii]|uniref:hypothetical protein n=1 Tax=Morganella morganii TaxID=582 RepID=UPI001C48EDC8|nr:hypothetical protein [Morganella morganii]QXO59267.1 hypothetical protein JC827_08215 [Morganella morganii]QXO78235.1 hypothetical protein JC794_08220 [Morganella morganii]